MSKFKHTPGPWHCMVRPTFDTYEIFGDPGYASTMDERAANARLIAAAPDMAAALDAIHALLDRQNWGQGTLLAIADIIERTGREIREPVPLSCYQCGRPTDWPTPDSRCPACTRYTPEQVRGEAE
jgi:rubrerythrin